MRELGLELDDLAVRRLLAIVLLGGREALGLLVRVVRGDDVLIAPLLVAERDVELGADRGIGLLALLERRARERVLVPQQVFPPVVEQLVRTLLVGTCRRSEPRHR